jgi:hypothetical protein
VYARSEYDATNHFDYPIFENYSRNEIGGSMQRFKRLILRTDGNNWGWQQTTMFQDAVVQSLFDHLHFKYQASQPSIVFLDGEYWGIHNLMELPDHYSLGYTYNIDPDEITIVEDNLNATNDLVRGPQSDLADYLQLNDYIYQTDLNMTGVYNYIESRIDVENFADYWIAKRLCGANQ